MNYGQRFNEEFQKALESKEFPAEKISCNWFYQVTRALFFASIIGLGLNPEDWANLLDVESRRKLTLYQFALLSNNLQARTPNDLELNLNEYAELMQEADNYVKIWQELSNSLREEVTTKLDEERKMQGAAEKGIGNILKPVKAEA